MSETRTAVAAEAEAEAEENSSMLSREAWNLLWHHDSSLTSLVGGGCFQAGFGRKADPEPGRCRRTDGKKWRCSKEAYPDSKYCERHMHRGKSRSRKPVELASSTPTTTATIPLTSINRNLSNPTVSPSSSSYSFSHPSSSAESEVYAHQNSSHRTFLYPHSSSSGPPESVFSPLNSTPHNLFLEPGSSPHADKQHRHYHGMREDVDERAFFPDGLVRARGVQDSYNQLPMSSYKGYSLPQFQTFADTSKEEQPQPGQHCFVLGTDIIKSSATRSIKLEKETETLKPLHHFFDHKRGSSQLSGLLAWRLAEYLSLSGANQEQTSTCDECSK
ncbi:hypothetical protein OIU84_022870 [Salix udensis]|uniref:Growth-regulating factor n=1 Tax=Salix udensis TaxID=889485 RepID=A0AAD6PF71_9ROSI|nr:hypothetical protein OIU84_022870 [Salix udensis]